MELSQKLKTLRKKRGLSQLELAEVLHVSRQAITGWEAGTSRPSTENMQSLSRLYNVPIEILLDDTVTAEPGPEKILVADRPEETREPEREKFRKGRRYKSIAIIISFLLIMIAIVILVHRGAGQEGSEVISFDEMESESVDDSGDTSKFQMGVYD